MSARYEVEVVRNVRIPTEDPQVTLSADIYMPFDAYGIPALVTVLPYRKDYLAGLQNQSSFRWFAERGYACLLVDLRGTGSSDGRPRPPFDPAEPEDAVAAIEWAAAQPWCNGRVGMWGLSYGGATTMGAASRGPAPLKAIMPISCPLDFARHSLYPAGCAP